MRPGTRREALLHRLRQADAPLSATALAKDLGVSRQIIVGDVALLRASGVTIASTPRGYVLPQPGGATATVVCRHSGADLEKELTLIVDSGCTCADVSVDHPVYGLLSGQLEISSRYDVQEFIQKVKENSATPLSALTGGVHLHRLRAADRAALDRARTALRQAGFLIE